jgi:hypothetical protein
MKLAYEPVPNGFHVRSMSPLGRYPHESFYSESSALIISSELCFSVVRVDREDWSFSELDHLSVQEIPLYGSILLAGKDGSPYLYPYPAPFSVELQTDALSTICPESVAECRSHLVDWIRDHNSNLYAPASSFHKPPILGGNKYDLVPDATDYADQRCILAKLEKANAVVLRSVSCLLKARMAHQYSELAEAGCLYLWIALDGAYGLILQELRRSGIQNPTSVDAARYFEKISGFGTNWEKFFEEDYANRIRAIHPDNRYGAEAIPQFLQDDFVELNDVLIPLFHYLVSDIE